MNEPAMCYVGLDEKEVRSIITRRAQSVALAARENASVDKLNDLHRNLLIAILNLGDLEKKKGPAEFIVPTGALIDDEIPV